MYKKQALINIRQNPKKFIKNWLSNIGRFFFHYPFSYRDQTINTYIVLVPNMFLLLLFIISLYPAFYSKNKVPLEIIVFLIFGLVYFCGSSLLSAYSRFSNPLIPVLLLWIIYVFNHLMEI